MASAPQLEAARPRSARARGGRAVHAEGRGNSAPPGRQGFHVKRMPFVQLKPELQGLMLGSRYQSW